MRASLIGLSPVSISFSIDQGEFKIESVGESGGSVNRRARHRTSALYGDEAGTATQHAYLFAPPASGLTITASLQLGTSALIYPTIVGSQNRLSQGMSKKPWICDA